jgi:hypothetical protein
MMPWGQFAPRLLAALLLAALVVPMVAGAATFRASLDRDTITLGESATLSLNFEGGSPPNTPVLPNIPNLQISGGGTSQQFSFSSGTQATSIFTYNFVLTPRQAGDYTIPALAAEVNGEKLTSQPLTLKVVHPSAPTPQAVNSGSQIAFLKLEPPGKAVYVGESFIVQMQLYVINQVRGISEPQFTAFPADGFVVGKITHGQGHSVQVGNAVYTVFPFSVVLKAVKAGSFALGPVTANIAVELPSNRQRDPFFDFFNRNEQRQIPLVTETQSIQSLPLPLDNVPPTFNGAVGNFTMTLTAGPTNVAAGDPITVKIQISGRGTLDSLTLPDQPAWHDFKTYPQASKLETDQMGLQGTKTFEEFVTPQNSDLKALPPVSFSFFDPEQKAYRTITHPGVPLTVRPGGATAAPTVVAAKANAQENAPPAQDIVPIKQRLGTVAQLGAPLATRSWFLGLQSMPLLAFVTMLVWRRRTEALANNPRLRRRRHVAQVIRDGMADLRKLAGEKKSEEFFATLSRLLQEQLGERLDLPASAITEAVIEERLAPRGVPEATCAPLQELFQTCNLARYAPIKSSQQLAAVIPKLESVLASLEKL